MLSCVLSARLGLWHKPNFCFPFSPVMVAGTVLYKAAVVYDYEEAAGIHILARVPAVLKGKDKNVATYGKRRRHTTFLTAMEN